MNVEALIKVDIKSLQEIPAVTDTKGFQMLEELLGDLADKVLDGLTDMKHRKGLTEFLLDNDQTQMYLVLEED